MTKRKVWEEPGWESILRDDSHADVIRNILLAWEELVDDDGMSNRDSESDFEKRVRERLAAFCKKTGLSSGLSEQAD